MKVYLKRDKSDENSRYIVYTHSGDELYRIVGRYTRSSHHMYVMKKDRCIAKIRDTHLALLRTCYVTCKENSFHLVVTNVRDNLAVKYHGIPLHIRGDVLNKSYDILDIDNSVISCVCRRFSTSHDALELNINEEKFEIHCIATAVFLDTTCTMDALALQAT